MPSRRSVLLDGCVNIAFIAASYAHIVLSPYTKVEESFSIQASHDILVHGISPTALAEYDHNAFPGAVPRSFLGPLLLSSLSYPVLVLFGTLGLVKTSADAALYIRLILATLFTTSILFFSYKALSDARLSARQQTWNRRAFIFISMLQFHPLFWAGRTTPNGIVSPVVFVALALVFSSSRLHRTRDYYAGLSMLTASMVVARMELVGIVIPIALVGLFSRSIGGSFASRLLRIAATGLITAISSIALSTIVDTYFWSRPFTLWNSFNQSAVHERGLLWPELEAILFNVVEGKSSEWGTSPWHSYWTMHLPKLLSFTMPLCLIGIATAPWTVSPRLPTLFVAAFHILTMSQLGHKELRFVSYLNPLLNLFAARAAVLLCSWRTLFYRRLGQAVVAGIFAATALITVVSLIASANNYPGGEAMRVLHDAVKTRNATVHVDVLPAMTGVNLFQSVHLHRPPSALRSLLDDGLSWTYDKTEDLDTSNINQWKHFTHLISDNRHCQFTDHFELLHPSTFVEFERISFKRPRLYLASLVSAPGVCLQGNRWKCLDALLPVHFHWREVVWLCQRRQRAMQ